ncbi:histone-lysine N-methyltransferase, H3 lysine-9 specific SUVH4 isoform X1 [Typha latifolia]|uniref:histone-lysine N-methyltransferase, H3 lysine-9 specific SUVH4 isoform X1 n=1 Tax=Typha latifolia TaxID=4733 RepID=UPI003C2C1C50
MVGDVGEGIPVAVMNVPVAPTCVEKMVADKEEKTLAPMMDASMVPMSVENVSSMEIAVGRRCSPRYIGKERPNFAEKNEVAEDSIGRRRSCRNIGKERVSYYAKKEESTTKKQTTRKRAKIDPLEGFIMPLLSSESEPVTSSRVEEAVSYGGVGDERTSIVVGGGVPDDGNGHGVENSLIAAVKSAKTRVKETLRAFNSHYLHFVQAEQRRVKEAEARALEPKEEGSCEENFKRKSRRPDLKAISQMLESKTVLYPVKRIGHLPGIDVGDQFFSRAEMVVLGMHSHWLNGIDYMGQEFKKMEEYKNYTFPLAICIVLSGMYEDDLDNSEDIIYTGQGGHDLLGKKQQICDQKMERGNLALKNSKENYVPVRVIRGHVSPSSYCGRVYTYDGLYKVEDYWPEKGLSGFTVYRYRLKRLDGQRSLTTTQVKFAREQVPKSISGLRGLVCDDISGGQEKVPIPVTNLFDSPPVAPSGFVYCKSLQVPNNWPIPENVLGCDCRGDCSNSRSCSCAKINGSDFPYVRKDGGRLVEAKSIVFECGVNCGCDLNCINRTSQQGLKYRLEVFKTAKKGWGVKSWDTIPAGAPICEYTGNLRRTDEIDSALDNNYIFDIDCLQTMKGLDGREKRPGDISFLGNSESDVPEYCIDAGAVGNIARFINHSCQPNLFVQCILSSHRDFKLAKVMLFAADTIPPLQELTYDYGYALDSVVGPDGNIVKMPCHCGAVDCRKRLY